MPVHGGQRIEEGRVLAVLGFCPWILLSTIVWARLALSVCRSMKPLLGLFSPDKRAPVDSTQSKQEYKNP
jgi:hypothetical protein